MTAPLGWDAAQRERDIIKSVLFQRGVNRTISERNLMLIFNWYGQTMSANSQ